VVSPSVAKPDAGSYERSPRTGEGDGAADGIRTHDLLHGNYIDAEEHPDLLALGDDVGEWMADLFG
jgi:hypothetical protein